jgi:Nitrogen permease regulator 2
VLQVIPHIDGVKYAKKISLDAEVDVEIVKRCVRALLYYNCVALIDIFQYSNVYTATDKVSTACMHVYAHLFYSDTNMRSTVTSLSSSALACENA